MSMLLIIRSSLVRGLGAWALGLAALCSGTVVQAQVLNTSAAHFRVNRYEATWRVNADASSVAESTYEREALSVQGAQMTTKMVVQYNPALETLEVLEAYTLKADGRKLAVGAAGIQVQQGVVSGGTGPSWPESNLLQLTFPDVQPGDRTGWSIRHKLNTPVLKGWAPRAEYLPAHVQFEHFKLRIEAPSSLGLQVFASALELKSSRSGELQVWDIEGGSDAKLLDNFAVNLRSVLPRSLASTFRTQEQLVAAYAEQSNAKAVVTPEVQALVARLTQGISTPQDQARVLYDWVRHNIRYVAVYLGAGGWIPHDVDWILKNRYGDCKDHVLLLQTMLRAAGIEAVPALIETSNEYDLPELPVGFNHAIIYLPGLGVFVDPTDSRMPFGALPWADADKPVAVALAQGAAVMRTPAYEAAQNRITIQTRLQVDPRGRAKGELSLQSTGISATTVQDYLAQIPAGMGSAAVQRFLQSSNYRGRGFIQYDALQRSQQTQNFRVTELEIDNLLPDPSAGAVSPLLMLNLPMYIHTQVGYYGSLKRQQALTCLPTIIREEFEISFDAAYTLLRSPTDVKEQGPDGISYEAQYRREGNTVQGWRELTQNLSRHLCSPDDYARRYPSMKRIEQNLRSSILFQQM